MPLAIYRRHTDECAVHNTGLLPAFKRNYRDCDCVIWIAGSTDTQIYPRQSTKLRDWKAAEAYLLSLDAKSKVAAVHGPTLEDCIKLYMDAKAHELGNSALDQTRLLLSRLRDYSHQNNKLFIQELSANFLETFITYGLAPMMKTTSKSTSISKLKCFLREAYRRSWILEPVREQLKPYGAEYEQKDPYTPEEVTKILEGAEHLNTGHVGYAKNGKTFRTLLELMLNTGIRVGDSIQHDPKKTMPGERTGEWIHSFNPQKQKKTKTKKSLDIYLDQQLKVSIDNCEWMSGELPFAYRSLSGLSEKDREYHVNYMAIEVWRNMQRIGKRCGIKDCRPHRLRDTFAVKLLMAGTPIEEVSRLLGHSSVKITEKYYAKWDKARQDLLARRFFDSRAAAKK